MATPKGTPAEAILRRRAFYLRIPLETLRAAQARRSQSAGHSAPDAAATEAHMNGRKPAEGALDREVKTP